MAKRNIQRGAKWLGRGDKLRPLADDGRKSKAEFMQAIRGFEATFGLADSIRTLPANSMLPSLLARDIQQGIQQFLITGFEPSDDFLHGQCD
ncbi:MAG: hypothetical protein K9K38_06195 [Rhodoferax sp.]|nr:hypothetical protein [Rhodoferax sp.]